MSESLRHLASIIEQNPEAMELFSAEEQVKISLLLTAKEIDELEGDDYE